MGSYRSKLVVGWSGRAGPATDGFGGINRATHATPEDSDKALCGFVCGADFGGYVDENGVGCKRCMAAIEKKENSND